MRITWLLGLIIVATAARAAPPPFSDEILTRAVQEASPRWKGTPGQRYREMQPVMALQLVAVAAHVAPERKIARTTLAASFAEKTLSFLRSSGPDAEGHTREPEAAGGLGGWTHNAAAMALLLAKRTPAVWEKFTADDRRRADLVMHALALAAHFTLDDDNDFCTLLEGVSITHKSWNPNITEPYADIALAASLYFGARELDEFFVAFDFDRFVGELRAANFLNIARNWTNVPKIRELMMQGGEMTGPGGPPPVKLGGVVGRGAGVKNPFNYRGWGLDHPWEIYRIQADRQFSRTVRTAVTIDGDNRTRLLHRATNAEMSPWEGRMGMMLEFESTDWDGLRSSLGYAFEGAMIHLGTAATLRVLGEWKNDPSGHDIERRMAIGIADLMFKAKEGYRGWSLGRERLNWYEQDLEPLGADFVFPLWSELFPPPDQANH